MNGYVKKTENEFEVKAPWGVIRGITWGESSHPPILVVHGKLDVCTGFRPLISLLPDKFYYVAIDLPGNGRSDPLPPGVRFTVIDLVPAVNIVRRHFGWEKFIYMGHSLGALIGKYFNIAYPGYITRVVEIDPVPAHHTFDFTREDMKRWYHNFYSSYEPEAYCKVYGGIDTAPKYTYEKAQEMIMKTRNMTKEASEHVLERCLVETGDGLYRFTYDQRMKSVTVLPFTGEILKKIYTTTATPTYAVIAQGEIDRGRYQNVAFVRNEQQWPNQNYKYKMVNGQHDVHIYNPSCMSEDIGRFLMEHFKSKL